MDRHNNFNLLRIVAAGAVAFSHAYPLTGNAAAEPLYALAKLKIGTVAVYAFFATSGFLVTGSALARPLVLDFLRARAQNFPRSLHSRSALDRHGRCVQH